MPSFYPGQLSVAAPEYGPVYTPGGYPRIKTEQTGYTPYHQNGMIHDKGFLLPDPYDPYKGPALPQPSMYPNPLAYSHGAVAAPQQLAAPMMAPIRMEDTWVSGQGSTAQCPPYQERSYSQQLPQQQHRQQQQQQQQQREDKPVGGVSQTLDYEMEQMTSFVADMTVDTIASGITPPENFRKWVLQVLNATRLPKATIFQSLSYLSLRVQLLINTGEFAPTERSLYQMLTVALILGSKFLDDNTFQNKSWAEVSNIKVAELNREELFWLEGFGHRLHHNMERSSGWNSWSEQWDRYIARAASMRSTLQPPLEQAVKRQRSTPLSLSPNVFQSQYQYPSPNVPNFALDTNVTQIPYSASTYDPWYGTRSAVEKSPSTAPHSGPTTPEYYGPSGIWRRADIYRQQHPFGYSGLQYHIPQSNVPFSGYTPPPFQHGTQGIWNMHGSDCQCATCRSCHFRPQRYGPIVVS